MNALRAQKKDEVSVVLCGEAGQGIQTVEQILVRYLKLSGFHVFATKEYMSRVRGGSNSTQIRISSKRASAYLDRIDILIPFHQGGIKHVEKRITPETIILGDREVISKDSPLEVKEFIDIPFSKIASDIGGRIYVNTIAAGVVLGTIGVEQHFLTNFIREFFSKKSEDVIKRNIDAIKKGYEVGTQILNSGKIEFTIRSSPRIKDENLLNGSEAVGLGALAGGCKFLSSYPMSPSTGVMVFLSQQMEDFDIVVEQAEDEISAINMAIGASYGGARSMVTTSGGGFALMIEGVSLAGMLEIPVVIHLSQRPGPATGLPTRTEQADLELALYSGHGEFPRIILAPGNLKDAFFLTQKAFNLADKYQIPVFVLTDQYLIDSLMNLPLLDISDTRDENHVVKTHKGYKRYELTEDGISPRGIPGFGEGLVGVDSDEHDEEAHITEDLILREKMVDKRLKKLDSIKKEIVPPELVGSSNYRVLITGWGSTYNVVREALQELGREDISFLHFKQVYPLYEGTRDYLQKAQKNIIIENNATSQFGKLIKLYTGMDIEAKILKYNGLAFSVEEVAAEIKKILGKEKV
ncbi:MAG TPA: 2-oxoacid:acceptor oxidoreductase subunit alpha [Candidatus Aminicenantes bacterium]|nr:2-oxoacid:acceptor oxidoreductase subunit alpha [Candidatus Aminicenantes bacterium]HEB34962.1 2-oxoacid:acceptor oxidoreductase subunit alpha [Candidatus Aminicenantes bacterium]